MKNYISEGTDLRMRAKALVIDFMRNTYECSSLNTGMRQAEIFRACGLDWGDYENANSDRQQYWVVALLRELEEEHQIVRDPVNKKWRIK